MRFLLDTHLLLWATDLPPQAGGALPQAVAEIVLDPASIPVFSAASIWEVAIKAAKGMQDFGVSVVEFRTTLLANGWSELPIDGAHATAVAELPPIHKDPFDRLLIAQATVEKVTLLTADATIARYPGPIRKV